jgi:hypothetical protein
MSALRGSGLVPGLQPEQVAGGRSIQGGHDWRQGFDCLDTLVPVDGQHENDRCDAGNAIEATAAAKISHR